MELYEYVTSELFIHDELLRRAETGLDSIVQAWRKNGRIEPFMVSWPSKKVPLDDGELSDDPVLCNLPIDRADWKEEITGFIVRTKPYALLLAEQYDNKILIIFETQHGTKSWHWPIKSHGQSRVLGDRTSKEDAENIGILWRANMARA